MNVHTEAARLNGATQAEIQEAVHYAKLVTGWSVYISWSVYINGLQVDYEEFAERSAGSSTT